MQVVSSETSESESSSLRMERHYLHSGTPALQTSSWRGRATLLLRRNEPLPADPEHRMLLKAALVLIDDPNDGLIVGAPGEMSDLHHVRQLLVALPMTRRIPLRES